MSSYLPASHFYIPRIEQREANLFMEEYYSNPDTTIYMDGAEQTEIGYISYTVQEQLKPLYGYASNTFDDMAIGNRVVVGAFKVPIRNPEIQTPFKDILESLSSDDSSSNDDYNKKQDDLLGSKEWIDNDDENGDVVTNENYIENDEIYTYVTKLEALGYDVNENSTMLEILNAIKEFQKNQGIEQFGYLDDNTKQEIDKKLKESDLDTVKIKSGTPIRLGPSNWYDEIKVIASECGAIVINDTLDGWTQILCEDGTEGYIQNEYIIS